MSQVCDICGKRPQVGFNISHSHKKTKRRFNPNLQRVRMLENGRVRRVRVCARCLRSGKVAKPA